MAKRKAFKVQDLYSQLDEMRSIISDLMDDQDKALAEIRYLSEFITYKRLNEEYRYFRENAHEEYEEDLPFPHLTL